MRALILVDIQVDFLPGGALPVPCGGEVIPIANALAASSAFRVVVATRDWHPPDHGSFVTQHPGRKVGDVIDLNGLSQVLWPVHGVQNTPGAALAPGLNQKPIQRLFDKGIDREVDSYSGFFDNGRRRATGLGAFLNQNGVTQAFVLGLATDYCVRATALDAAALGFETHLVQDGCRGVELKPGDIARALGDARRAGVQVITSAEASARLKSD